MTSKAVVKRLAEPISPCFSLLGNSKLFIYQFLPASVFFIFSQPILIMCTRFSDIPNLFRALYWWFWRSMILFIQKEKVKCLNLAVCLLNVQLTFVTVYFHTFSINSFSTRNTELLAGKFRCKNALFCCVFLTRLWAFTSIGVHKCFSKITHSSLLNSDNAL